MSSTYREELERYLKEVDVSVDVLLDIGGSQLPLKSRVKGWNVARYIVADLAQPHAESPKPDYEVDINHPFDLIYNGKKLQADIVTCLEVFEYVWNPVVAFVNISNHLKGNGYAIVSFPFMYPTHNPIEDDCLRYTEFGIRKLADSAGLQIRQIIRRRPQTQALRAFFSSERMRAAKDYDHDVTGWIVILEHKQ